jgi:hypothetical protein
MKIQYIIALVIAALYLLFKSSTSTTTNPAACTTCGGSATVTDTMQSVETVASDSTQTQIPTSISQGFSTGYIPPPASPLHPILTANDPTAVNFFMRGTPSALISA